ncbi:hypothetical protein IFR04_012361 [Cadophora malorum]|uniref:NAD-dependent epimerase/dehydratase domain-containing protein n=1 Tax=Cadophora malorum TaxID=108018 RepID=A0A8H7T920_9HELO|nr:hypothetical protein IFR04_012361 [Cadophora malorum]
MPLVLVTGINGFIGGHVADQFLEAGYNVRGTARTISRADTIKQCLTEKHGKGRLEVVAVPAIAIDGAFEEAVKGVSAVAHVASNVSFDEDASKVIPHAISATASILNSCLAQPSVKSFVLTSSSTACQGPKPNVPGSIDANTWNEEDIKDAWAPRSARKERELSHGWVVYGASKTEAEKALWNFRDEKKPHFTVNAVLPGTNFGPVFSKEEASSTGAFVKMICEGKMEALKDVLPQYYVDVQDAARLHVAAVKFSDVADQRIFAQAKPYNWNEVLGILRELRPEQNFPAEIPGLGNDLTKVDNAGAEALLIRMGRPGFIGLRETLEQSLTSFLY